MKFQMQASALSFALLLASSQAFVPSSRTFRAQRLDVATRPSFVDSPSPAALRATSESTIYEHGIDYSNTVAEAERLRTMAQQLRNEAATLAAEQAQKVSEAAMKVFAKFDRNNDGTISVDELKVGLEKATKHEIPQNRIEKLLQKFDSNGDGVLQKEEFASVDKLKNQLDYIVREEKAVALAEAKLEKKLEEQKSQREMIVSLINDGEPTNTDKFVSVLPYLFPLIESLQFAGPWVTSHPDNVVAQVAAVAYGLYRSIPLSGFLTFFALNFFAGDLSLNRLVRFNLQQAIYLDIALFIPGFLAAALAAASSGSPAAGTAFELVSDGVALTALATILYASATSLLGKTPDQVPWISDRVKNRMITPDMFDEEGRFIGLSRGLDDNDDKKEQ